MRTCSKCKSLKDESEFHCRPNGKFYSECKPCHRKYTKKHYQDNKKYYLKKSKITTEKVRLWFVEYKSKLSCETCGENHPATFDFHHIDPKKKEDCISVLVGRGSLEKLKKELKKCKTLCANCHRKLHFEEKQ